MARLVGRRPVETKISALDSGSIPIYNSDLKSWDVINISDVTSSVFPYTGSAIISGSLVVSGSTNIVGTTGTTLLSTNADTLIFTGSLYTSGSIISTGSLEVKGGITGSLLGTSSFASTASRAISSSYAETASYANNFTVAGTLTAQTIVAQTITSSTEFITGSTKFGSELSNTHQFTGSVSITGSLEVNGRNYINDSSSFADRITTNSASFVSFSGSYVGESSSFASRITVNSASFATFSGSYVNESSSFASRITTNSASLASFSGSYVNESSSFASRITTNSASFASFSGSYINESSSFASRITTNSASISSLSASFNVFSGSYNTGSFTGSFKGDGNELYNIPASGIVGLNLSQIASGSVTASISPVDGFRINTDTKITGSLQVTNGITGSLSGTASYADNANLLDGKDSSIFATTGSNTFKGTQTIDGNLFMSGSFRLVYNNDPTNNMLFGMFDGSTIYGPYYQLFGNQYSNVSQRGGAEFVYDIRNNADANFHIASYDGSTWTQKFIVNDTGAQITGSLQVSNGITGSLLGTASYASQALSASYAETASNAPDYLPLAGGTMTGDLYASGRTFWLQDLILGYGTTFGKITTDGSKYISIMPNYNVESARFWSNGNVTIQDAGTYVDNGFRLDVSGSGRFTDGLIVTGSLITANGITGSLLGTASYANNALSSSYALTASYWSGSISNVSTASYALNAVSSSYAATASFADDFIVRGTLTAQTIIAQTITSSTEYVTGSTQFGSLLSNTHQFTGSVNITGSLLINGENLTGLSSSLASRITSDSSSFETRITTNSASFAAFSGSYINESSSFASRITTNSASIAAFSSSYVNESSSFASRITTNSASISSLSASFNIFSGSYNTGSFTGSFKGDGTGLYNIPASGIVGLNLSQIASGSTTASISPVDGFRVNTNTEITGSLIVTGGITGSLQGTASYANNANLLDGKDSSVFASTGSNSFSGSQTISSGFKLFTDAVENLTGNTLNLFGDVKFNGNVVDVPNDLAVTGSLNAPNITGSLLGTASYAISSSYALSASYARNSTTASYALTALSSSYALTASYAQDIRISGSVNNVSYIDFNTSSAAPAWKSGRVFWDNTDGCLAVYNAEADVTLQVGQENWTRVRNNTGTTITNGTIVRIIGAQGDAPTVVRAQSIAKSGSINVDTQILGVATHNIEDSSFGYVTTQGLVRGLNTSAFNDGDTLFVGTGSAGALQNTAPIAPFEIIPVGVCVKASPGGSGIIYVAVQQPLDFSDLSTVKVQGVYSYGDLWTYVQSGSYGVWTHTNQLSGSYGITGSLSITNGITGSLLGTASYANNANLLDGKDSTIFATTGSNIFIGNQTISGSLVVSGSTTILNNLTVLGTASYNTVTASSLLVNDNWITVTTTSSFGRFGGIRVLDYEGAGETASFAWDTTADRWIEIAPAHDTYSSSLFIMGPKNSGSLGDEFGLTPNYIPRAEDEHHLIDSAISDNGTNIILGRNSIITGSLNVTQGVTASLLGTASYASQALQASSASYWSGSIKHAETSSYSFYAESVGGIISGSIVTTGSNNFVGNQTISGSLSVTGNLSVLGTASFTYVTASQLALSASFVSVNVFEPAERFGGLKVYDSGSLSHQATASLAWDSLKNRWIYQNASGSSYDGAIIMAGPRNTGSLGDERALTSGRIPKSVGGDHIDDSIISEISGSIGVSGSLVVTGSFGLLQSLYVNQNTSSLTSGTKIISTNSTGSYTSAFCNYVLSSGSNARAGQFITVWNGSSINYTDVSTTDIGSTLSVVFTASLSSGNVVLSTVLPSNDWTIKTTVNLL